MDLSFLINDAFREIFQSMSEGIIIVDEGGEIIATNPVSERIFGYEVGELIGRPMEKLLPERYRSRHVNYRENFNADPIPRRMGTGRDLRALRKDGVEFPVEISLSYTRLNGRLLVMAFISDITMRKKAEDAIRQSEEQLIVYAAELENKVDERTQELNKTILKLETEVKERKRAEEEVRRALDRERELNELKSKFVSIASHEFRTPLSTVMSSAALVKKYKDNGELSKIDRHVERIKTTVNHLTQILNDFLSLGKLEEGKVLAQYEPINIHDFMQEVKEDVRAMLKEGQDIVLDCDGTITEFQSDARILRNIMFNLISNASKYSPENRKIWVSCSNRDEVVQFDVRDEGLGIPKEDQRHLFERFFRASNAGNIEGTGLGLNIVKRYTELLEGKIDFVSDYGKGTTFSITLPSFKKQENK
jgi:PAS domain S-box-containing protein